MSDQPQSPFLPGTNIQFAWDSTSLGYLKTCPRLYYYHMIDGWASKDESVHLRFGIEYHSALQDYDLSRAANIDHDDAVHDVVRELLIRTADFDPDHKTKTRESLVRTVIWYLDKFKDDPATTVILSDGKPAVEQSFRFELDWGPRSALTTREDMFEEANGKEVGDEIRVPFYRQPYILCGHLDRVVSFNDELFVMDRKTTSIGLGPFYFSQFEPNNQMTLYTFASKVILDAPVRGVIIDAARIAVDYSEFGRGFTYRTQDQLEEWIADLHYWFALQEQFAIADNWPMNDTACDKFGGCKFKEICSKSPAVRERFLEGNFVKQAPEDRWNPLRSR